MKKILSLLLSCAMIVAFATNVNAESTGPDDNTVPGMENYNLTIKKMECNYDIAYAVYKRLVEVRKENGQETTGSLTKGAQNLAMQRAAEFCVTGGHFRPDLKDSNVASYGYNYKSFTEDLSTVSSGLSAEEAAKDVIDGFLSDSHMRDIYAVDLSDEIGVGCVNNHLALVTHAVGNGKQDTSDAVTSGIEYKDFTMPFGTMGKTLTPKHTDDEGVIINSPGFIDLSSSTNPLYGTVPDTKEYTVKTGDTMTLYIYQEQFTDSMTPEHITVYPYLQVAPECFRWTSSNPEVASVDSTGKVTALKDGTAEISYALTDTLKNTVTVNVKTPEAPKPKNLSNAYIKDNGQTAWLAYEDNAIPCDEFEVEQKSNHNFTYYKVTGKNINYTGTIYLKGSFTGESAQGGNFVKDARIISEDDYNKGLEDYKNTALTELEKPDIHTNQNALQTENSQKAPEKAESQSGESEKAPLKDEKSSEKTSQKKKTVKKKSVKKTKVSQKSAKKKSKKIKITAPKKMTIRKGKYYKLKVKVTNKSKKTKVTYKSSSKKLKIKKGKIKASRKGKYTVTVKVGKTAKKIKITVK